MSIKYYHLAKDEELPDEFCAVRDIGGEPSEYTFYVPESEVAKLRELIRDMWLNDDIHECEHCPVVEFGCVGCDCSQYPARMRELGVEV